MNGKRPKKLDNFVLFWEERQKESYHSEYFEEKERSKVFVDENFRDDTLLIELAQENIDAF